MTQPVVSVVVVNFNGLRHLEPCFSSLVKQTYPAHRVELLLVDNASRDGSLEFMAERFPQVRVIANQENVGFAPAVNQGARAATGQYVAFMNNDAYADPDWIAEMVTLLEAQQPNGVVCVGAKMLDWHGQRIDFAGGGVNFYGMGNQFFHGLPTDAVTVPEQEVLFACGGAMLIDREIFLQVGGFDQDYFAYFEDVDLGWRLWIYGYRVMLAPKAIVHHRQHATSSSMYGHQINTLFERNALLTILKNYDDEHLQRTLGVAVLLMIGRSLSTLDGVIDRKEFRVGFRDPKANFSSTMEVPKLTMSYLVALQDIFQSFPDIWTKRRLIQSNRKRDDKDIVPLFRYPFGSSYHGAPYLQLQQRLVESFNVREAFPDMRMNRILIFSVDPLYENLAGPGIRVVEMARYLAQSCHVVLAAPERNEVRIPGVECVTLQRRDLAAIERLVTEFEAVIVQGYVLEHYPFIKNLNRVIIIDLYDPFHLENLQTHSRLPLVEQAAPANVNRAVVNELLRVGDFFICASERQRDFWLGALGTLGRLTPAKYQEDPSFRSLIDTVPFGLDPHPPVHRRRVLKGVVPGIAADDTVLLWGGGIWDWLDPLTVIQAIALIGTERPDIKLFFLGMRHPNPADVPEMLMYERAVALAAELGLLNKTVFFNDRWVPYAERENYFLEADIGVSAHLEHVETRFAFRTRLLDYIWAGLPMVVSAGDTLADVVAQRDLGQVVAIGDPAAFATAILGLANQADARAVYAAAFAGVQQEFAWPEALKPLIAFCQHPRYAHDKLEIVEAEGQTGAGTVLPSFQNRLDELDAVVAQKNEHIAYLEGLIRQLESGRVMRVLRRLSRS